MLVKQHNPSLLVGCGVGDKGEECGGYHICHLCGWVDYGEAPLRIDTSSDEETNTEEDELPDAGKDKGSDNSKDAEDAGGGKRDTAGTGKVKALAKIMRLWLHPKAYQYLSSLYVCFLVGWVRGRRQAHNPTLAKIMRLQGKGNCLKGQLTFVNHTLIGF